MMNTCEAYGLLQSSTTWNKLCTHTKHKHQQKYEWFLDIFITIQYSQSFMLFTFDCCIVLVYQCIIIDGVVAFFAQCMHLHVVLRSFRRRMTEASLEWPHVEVAQVRLSLWRSLATTSRRQDFPCFEAGPLLSLASNKGATQILIQIMMSNHQVSSSIIKVHIQCLSNGSWWISFCSLF